MASAYLTPDEVKELTGYVMRAAACRWLDRNGWPYATPAARKEKSRSKRLISKKFLGWLMGLEPTTTGITIRDSTN